jgi:hypothetical protein
MIRGITFLLLCTSVITADVGAVKSEPNPEKRSDLALAHAEQEIDAAKKAYDAEDLAAFRRSVEEVAELADISSDSLESTGKRARRSPKYFKRAEQKLLVLLRRLDSLEKDVSLEDRDLVTSVRKRVASIHESILNDIMTKK